ncbi:hypothetical protein MMPV_002643 [Pyropia vietnamensis]
MNSAPKKTDAPPKGGPKAGMVEDDDDIEPIVSSMEALRTAWPWLLPRKAQHRRYLAMAIGAQIVLDACMFVRPLLLRYAMAGLRAASTQAEAWVRSDADPVKEIADAAAGIVPPMSPAAGRAVPPIMRRLTLALATSAANVVGPALDRLSQNILPSSPSQRPLVAIVGYIVTSYAYGLLSNARFVWWRRAQDSMIRDLQLSTFAHLHVLSLGWHLNRHPSQALRILQSRVFSVTELLQLCSLQFVPIFTSSTMNVAVLWRLGSWHLSLLAAVCMAMYSLLMFLTTRLQMQKRGAMLRADCRESVRAIDSLFNVEAVKTFATESVEVRRYKKTLEYRQNRRYPTSMSTLLRHAKSAVESIFIATGMVTAGRRVMEGTLSMEDFVACQSYLYCIFSPVSYAAQAVRNWQASLLSLRKLVDLHNEQPSVIDAPGAPELDIHPTATCRGGRVEFENVSFTYGGDSAGALHNLSFTVPAGSTTAIVGPTGAGKSTIVRLLLRLFDIPSGRIAVDGQDVASVTQASLRQSISVVPQDCRLIGTSVRDNISYVKNGGEGVSDEDIMAAAEVAQLTDWIERLPNGLDSDFGHQGQRLSGGERQRIGIARAVVRNAPVLLLDESSSSLDSATERAMQVAMRRASAGATTILIAHRLSTVIRANQILVLEGGRIIERGTHQELLAMKRGRYRRMWAIQQGGDMNDSDSDDGGWARVDDDMQAHSDESVVDKGQEGASETDCFPDERAGETEGHTAAGATEGHTTVGATEERTRAGATMAIGVEMTVSTAGEDGATRSTPDVGGGADAVGGTDPDLTTSVDQAADAAQPSNGVAVTCDAATCEEGQGPPITAEPGTHGDGSAVGNCSNVADAGAGTGKGGA